MDRYVTPLAGQHSRLYVAAWACLPIHNVIVTVDVDECQRHYGIDICL